MFSDSVKHHENTGDPARATHTHSITRSGALLAGMTRALLLELCPGSVVVADEVGLPDWGGVRLTQCESGRWLCVLVESSLPDGVSAALAAGCSAVLTVGSSQDEFSRALEALRPGAHVFVPSDLVKLMAQQAVAERSRWEQRAPANADTLVRLTDREREVLRLVAAGKSNLEISETLTISTNTVRSHLRALAVKLDASSRTRILANARALGIAEATELDKRSDPRRPLSA